MADESKQYDNFNLEVTEEKIIVTVKANTQMFVTASALPAEALAMTKNVLPNGDLQLVRIRNPQNHMLDIMFAASMGVDVDALGPNPWAHLDNAIHQQPIQKGFALKILQLFICYFCMLICIL